MTRVQIRLPDPLYDRLMRIAEEQDWSLAEVIKRAGELYAQRFPDRPTTTGGWKLPAPIDLGKAKVDNRRMEAAATIERTAKR